MWELGPTILFWILILVTVALSIMGIVRRRLAWLVVATVVAVPFGLYLAAFTGLGWLGLIFPLLFAGASTAIYHHRTEVAWSLLAPFFGVIGWLIIAVVSQ